MSSPPPNPCAPVTPNVAPATRLILLAGLSSLGLAAVKIGTGIAGNSYALVADGIESLTDVVTSIAVVIGMTLSLRPADESHPWGHGKLETFASLFVSLGLTASAALIAWQSYQEILSPQDAPAWFTLPVLVAVIAVKIGVSRAIARRGGEAGSRAMEADAWHHLSDALTSGAAFVGISIALLAGPGYEAADDWAALLACAVILWNGLRLAKGGFLELMETRAPLEIETRLRGVAEGVDGVCAVEKLRARKSGLSYIMDIHIEVNGDLSVTAGHDIAGAVKGALMTSDLPVGDVTVHVEPFEPTDRW